MASSSVVALADENGLELWLAFGNADLGWAEAEWGQAAKGIEQIRRGLAAYEATGAKLWRPYFLGLLAMALCKPDQVEEALAVANEAVALAELTGERYSTAELFRIKGETSLRAGAANPADMGTISQAAVHAQACFAEGLRIARQQGAKAWELRLLTSMERFNQQKSNPVDAGKC